MGVTLCQDEKKSQVMKQVNGLLWVIGIGPLEVGMVVRKTLDGKILHN